MPSLKPQRNHHDGCCPQGRIIISIIIASATINWYAIMVVMAIMYSFTFESWYRIKLVPMLGESTHSWLPASLTLCAFMRVISLTIWHYCLSSRLQYRRIVPAIPPLTSLAVCNLTVAREPQLVYYGQHELIVTLPHFAPSIIHAQFMVTLRYSDSW